MADQLRRRPSRAPARHALELEGVGAAFRRAGGAGRTSIMRIAAGERRAVLGSNGAGKTTLFNADHRRLPADRSAASASSARTSPICRRMSGSGAACGAPTRSRSCSAGSRCIDSVFLACRGVSRRRFSLLRPRRDDVTMAQATSIVSAVHLDGIADTPVATLSHGQQRQLEIALALAGAPRFILFDEPAAGLSPTERRDLVAILNALPKHIGYIIIEHDLDVALRVSEYVSMMHNGRVFKEGTPAGDRGRSRGPGDLSRRRRPWLSAPAARPIAQDRRPSRLLRREPRPSGRVADAGTRRAVGGRPQRHGQDHALQHHRRPEARALRLDPRRRPRDARAGAARDPPGSASAMCRRAAASGRA